jgi:autotransporter translocation and assembly factor TamB
VGLPSNEPGWPRPAFTRAVFRILAMTTIRRWLQITLFLITLLVAITAAVVILTQTGWFRNWLRGVIEQEGARYLNGRLTVQQLGGNIFFGVSLTGVAITMDGQTVIAVKEASIDYDLFDLLGKNLVLTSVKVRSPVVRLSSENGHLNLSDLVRRRDQATEKTSGRAFGIEEIEVENGTVTIGPGVVGTSGSSDSFVPPSEIRNLSGRVSLSSGSSGLALGLEGVSFAGRSPRLEVNRLGGTIAFSGGDLLLHDVTFEMPRTSLRVDGAIYHYRDNPSFDLQATSDQLNLDEIARVVPSLGQFALQPTFSHMDVVAKGPVDDLHLKVDLRSKAGSISGDIVLDPPPDQQVRRIKGTLNLQNFDAGPLLGRPVELRTDITGVAKVDLQVEKAAGTSSVRGSYSLKAGSASAFGYLAHDLDAMGRIEGDRVVITSANGRALGARVAASGTIDLPRSGRPVGYGLRGHVEGLDMRDLPRSWKLPRPPSNLTFDYEVAGSGTVANGSADLARSTLTNATIETGTKATFSYSGAGRLSYGGKGSLTHLDLRSVGAGFGIAALQAPRFASDISGHFDVSGGGTSLDSIRLDASGDVHDSTLMSVAFPQATLEAHLAGRTLRTKQSGRFKGLDPREVAQLDSVPAGDLNGSFDLEVGLLDLGASGFSVVDDLSLSGSMSLGASTLAGLHVGNAEFEGSYAKRAGDIRRLAAAGPDLKLTANGPFALNDNGQSNLSYHLEAQDLGRIGKLIGQPVSGAATVDGTITGNAPRLAISGRFKGSNLSYSSISALDANSQFDAGLANLDPSSTSVEAKTNASLVKVLGQEIDQLVARTTYAERSLDFDVDARQPKRHVQAQGDLLIQPESEQMRVRSLAIQSAGIDWSLAQGLRPSVEHSVDRVVLKDFTLESGSQKISAEGAIGRDKSDFQVRVSDVALSNVDALMLTNRRTGGVLNAQATLTGPRDDMDITTSFSVTGGSFEQFKYQSLAGRLNYARGRIGIGVRLEQDPKAWVMAQGSIPIALFQSKPAGQAAAQPVDLHVWSNPLDLAVVEGVTTTLQKVQGNLSIDATVGGAAGAPVLDGRVTVSDGAFKVAPTGVAYHGVNAAFLLRSDRVRVQKLTLIDPRGKTMTMSGDLSVNARELTGFNVEVSAKSFQVIDNELAQATLNTSLTIGGGLRGPDVKGTIAIDTGKVSIDKVLAVFSSSAYSTSAEVPVSVGGGPAAGSSSGPPANEPARKGKAEPVTPGTTVEQQSSTVSPQSASPSPFDAATLDLHVTVPDDLVVKGSDVRIGQTSIGMGNVDMILGGDVRVEKQARQPVRLVGTVRTVRGTYEFQGRRFDIQRGGELGFEGAQPPNPSLDITATRVITGVETRVHVGGTVLKPDLTLTSNPPLDQADILSLIIFGQPSNQLGTGEQASLAQRAGAIASGFVASKLAQSIGSALNLDTFEIQTATVGSQTSAVVTIGQQIGQRLYVKLRQGVGAESTSQFVLDYQLTSFMRFESTMSQGGVPTRNLIQRADQSGADLVFFFSF